MEPKKRPSDTKLVEIRRRIAEMRREFNANIHVNFPQWSGESDEAKKFYTNWLEEKVLELEDEIRQMYKEL